EGAPVRDVSAHPDIRELYLAADVLVTDYSSAMFDFAVTGRPILLFTYDLADYRDRLRGFYFDLEEIAPGPLLGTSDEVLTGLRRSLPKPLTPLEDGRSILQQQLDGVRAAFGADTPITAVVGYRCKQLMRAAPELLFTYNPDFATTNTSQSLLRALRTSRPG